MSDRPNVVVVTKYRDEPGLIDWLAHYRPMCRGFILVDDRSATPTDLSADPDVICHIRRHPSLQFNEPLCCRLLYEVAATVDAEWFLHVDVDEFIDPIFVEELPKIGPRVTHLRFLCLFMHPDPDHFIVEGIYKPQGRIVGWRKSSQRQILRPDPPIMHVVRYPDWNVEQQQAIDKVPCVEHMKALLFHHNMYGDRPQRRYDHYEKLDPHSTFQTAGYNHLLQTFSYAPVHDLHTIYDLLEAHDALISGPWRKKYAKK